MDCTEIFTVNEDQLQSEPETIDTKVDEYNLHMTASWDSRQVEKSDSMHCSWLSIYFIGSPTSGLLRLAVAIRSSLRPVMRQLGADSAKC